MICPHCGKAIPKQTQAAKQAVGKQWRVLPAYIQYLPFRDTPSRMQIFSFDERGMAAYDDKPTDRYGSQYYGISNQVFEARQNREEA